MAELADFSKRRVSWSLIQNTKKYICRFEEVLDHFQFSRIMSRSVDSYSKNTVPGKIHYTNFLLF